MQILERLKTDRKFLIGTIVIGLFLVVLQYAAIPLIILWWFFFKLRLAGKVKASILGGLLIGFIILTVWYGMTHDTSQYRKAEEVAEPTITQEPTIQTAPTVQVTPTVIISETIAPSPRINNEDRVSQEIAYQIKKSIGEKTNAYKDKVLEVRATETSESSNQFTVFIAIQANDLITSEAIKAQIIIENSDIYMTLFKDRKDVKEAWIVSYVTMVDKYGQQSDDVVYKTSLSVDEATKVNWDSPRSRLRYEILPSIWTVQKDLLK